MDAKDKIDRLKRQAEAATRCADTDRRECDFYLYSGNPESAGWRMDSALTHELVAEACLNEAIRLACEEEK